MANTNDDAEEKPHEEENFGLPDIEYKPLDQLEETPRRAEEPASEEHRSHESSMDDSETAPVYEEEEEGRSNAPFVITLIIALVVLVAGFMIYKYVYVPKQEKARLDQLAKDKEAAERKAEEERQAKIAEEERLKHEAEAKVKPSGSIETLNQRTGHYFVIISSSIDGDLAMDQAKKLSAKGVSSKIIPPFGKWKFYRLGIGDFDSFSNAQTSADASKTEYGNALWVMKF
jgi:hypothetical protein